jgi:hypothetical protein
MVVRAHLLQDMRAQSRTRFIKLYAGSSKQAGTLTNGLPGMSQDTDRETYKYPTADLCRKASII